MTHSRWKIVSVVAMTMMLSWALAFHVSADKVKVTYAAWANEGELPRFQAAAEYFNAIQDEIEVEFIHSIGDHHEFVTVRIAGGVGPDSFHVGDGDIARFALEGMVEDLGPYMDRDDTFGLDDFYPPMTTLGIYDGHVYGLPPDENPLVMYVNLDMFERAGLPSPVELDKNGEWTWDAFRDAARAISRALTTEDKIVYGFFLNNWWGPIMPFVWGAGGDFFTDDGFGSRLMDPNTIRAIDFLAAMIHEDGSATHVLPADMHQMFLEGRLAMIPQGRWEVPGYKTLLENVTWDVVPMPIGPTGERTTAIAGAFSAMNRYSPNKEAAWKWLRFFLGPEGQRIRLGGNGNAVPSIRGVEDVVTGPGELPDNAQVFIDGAIYGRPLPVALGMSSEISSIIFSALDQVWHGEKSASVALDEINASVESLLGGLSDR